MPTVLRSGSYRLFFFSADRDEPPHVHVERDGRRAKFWLTPVRLQDSGTFRRIELARLEKIVERNAETLLERWHEFFGE